MFISSVARMAAASVLPVPVSKWGAMALIALALGACGGGDGDDGDGGGGNQTFTVGGTLSGLNANGSVVLQNNGGSNLTVSANGSFSFGTPLNSGAGYNVSVSTQPTGQTCAVANGVGTNLSANVTTVAVTCTANTYTIGGTISGLNGDLVLQNNGGNNLSRSADGNFTIGTGVPHGGAYAVTVLAQPSGQACTVAPNGSGLATANVSIAITCTANPHTIGGTLAGLGAGTVVLQNNLGDDLSLSGAGTSFAFPTALASDSPYFVSVRTQPTGQTCTVANDAGTATSSVTNVQVTCADNPATATVEFAVTGLNGSVTLRNIWFNGTTNVTDDRTVAADGTYTFAGTVNSGAIINVSVLTQPTSQRCVVYYNVRLATSNVTGVRVVCTDGTALYTVGGQVEGLTQSGLLLFRDVNAGALAPLQAGATSFVFPLGLTPGTAWNIGIVAQPPGQTCIIRFNEEDEMPAADIAPVRITCVDNSTSPLMGTYSVSDTAGLAGGNRFFLTLYPDGVYLMATRQDNPDCGQNNGNGVELGAYNYNSTTGAFTIVSNVLDTNGECGVWDGGSSFSATVQKTGVGQGTVLTLTNPESTFTLTPVPSVANTLVGSFRVPFAYDTAILGDDGRYTITHAATQGDEVGIEYACYSRTGTSDGTFTVDAAPASCPGVVDTNADAGLFEPGETGPKSFPYSISSPYQFGITIDDTPYPLNRVIPN